MSNHAKHTSIYLDDDDDDAAVAKKKEKKSGEKQFREFDCPGCTANNPTPFDFGDEILCFYCGCSYDVKVKDDETYVLRET